MLVFTSNTVDADFVKGSKWLLLIYGMERNKCEMFNYIPVTKWPNTSILMHGRPGGKETLTQSQAHFDNDCSSC